MFDTLSCRVCGCTDEAGCPGGCYWVRDDVCSQCVTAVALIACSKGKRLGGTPEELYTGRLLHRQLAYAHRVLQLPDSCIFILSARYGLVPLARRIAPYEMVLTSLSARERDMWGFRVVNELVQAAPGMVAAYVMAGAAYRTAVTVYLEQWCEWEVPHPAGMGIGQQLAWYTQQVAGVGG